MGTNRKCCYEIEYNDASLAEVFSGHEAYAGDKRHTTMVFEAGFGGFC